MAYRSRLTTRFVRFWVALFVLTLLPLTSFSSKEVSAATTNTTLQPWSTNGPYNEVGHAGISQIDAITLSPSYESDGTLFAMVEGSGIYKSTDRGVSWKNCVLAAIIDSGPTSLGLAPNFSANQTLFIGGWFGGMFKSVDGCTSWGNTNLGDNRLTSISISPNYLNDKTIFAGTYGSQYTAVTVLKSNDGGNTWVASGNGIPTDLPIRDLAISPTYQNDQTIFAATGNPSRGSIFKSSDAGSSWSQATTGMKVSTSVYHLAISPDFATDRTIFATTNDGLYKSTDAAASWFLISYPFPEFAPSIRSSVAISPNYVADRTVFFGYSNEIFKSTDAGATWSIVLDNLAGDVTAISVSPSYVNDQTVFAGTLYEGIFKSSNSGQSWVTANNGISALSVNSLAVSPDSKAVFAGTNGSIFLSNDMGKSWVSRGNGIRNFGVFALSVSPAYDVDSTVFAGVRSDGVYKSIDGGQNWILTLETGQFVTDIAISPDFRSDGVVFAATQPFFSTTAIYKSIDHGETWSLLATGPTNWVKALVISPNYATDQTIFAGVEEEGVLISNDGGNSWYASNAGLSDNGRGIYDLIISPNYSIDKTLYAALGGGIFKSVNGGVSWTSVFAGQVDTLAISPQYATDSTLFAGKSLYDGVLVSTDAGQTWTVSGERLGNYHTLSLAVSSSQPMVLFDGTRGSGVWQSTITSTPINQEIDYFALGDSIASGHGLIDDGSACRRSYGGAYPFKVWSMLKMRYTTVNFPRENFLACSGATVREPDAKTKRQDPNKWFQNQVDYVVNQLSDRPVLVSITIGSNDFGWSDPPKFLDRLYIKGSNKFAAWVDDTVYNPRTGIKTVLKGQVERLLAHQNVAVVITEVHNPFNTSSYLFLGIGPNSCGALPSLCYDRTERAVHTLNTAINDIMTDISPPERQRLQIAAVHEKFHADGGHESPQTACGLDTPVRANTWIQYPGDPTSNSFWNFPKWVRALLPQYWGGDCFHPNEIGAIEYGKSVNERAVLIGR